MGEIYVCAFVKSIQGLKTNSLHHFKTKIRLQNMEQRIIYTLINYRGRYWKGIQAFPAAYF
jgi:hypothetical protein